MQRRYLITIAALAALSGSSAFAQEGGIQGATGTGMGSTGGDTSQVMFSDLDANEDNYISQNEAYAYPPLADNWTTADTNDDNRLDESEFSAFEE